MDLGTAGRFQWLVPGSHHPGLTMAGLEQGRAPRSTNLIRNLSVSHYAVVIRYSKTDSLCLLRKEVCSWENTDSKEASSWGLGISAPNFNQDREEVQRVLCGRVLGSCCCEWKQRKEEYGPDLKKLYGALADFPRDAYGLAGKAGASSALRPHGLPLWKSRAL